MSALSAELSDTLPPESLSQEQGEAILSLSLRREDNGAFGPAILGRYRHAGQSLIFTPRIPLTGGSTYRARLHLPGEQCVLDYTVPVSASGTPPRILSIYPSADLLPANQLRFYLYFDRAMRGGRDMFKHLRLLDGNGVEIEAPWLDDEIWDEGSHCLVLYIHPGRIKRGVELRESIGPVLHENQSYSLVVGGGWTDTDGHKLGRDVLKKFRTTEENRARVNLANWRLSAPGAGTSDAVNLELGQVVDYRSLFSGVVVLEAGGEPVAGTILAGKDEKSWHFVPAAPWKAGAYLLEISPDLEDVAGNTPTRPFDADLHAHPEPAQSLRLHFKVVF